MGLLDVAPPVLRSQHVGEVLEVWLAPEHRGQGLGRRLVALLTDALCRRGATVLRAAVPRVDEPAQRQLAAAGYVPLQYVLERALDAG
jgi:ribosomal protein S18 acetylase RimI-like enzyme